MDILCIKCKGRGFCKKKCKWMEMSFKSFNFSKDFTGSSPSIFVGKANYPNVSIGIMSLPFTSIDANNFDNPKFFSNNLSISQVITKRSLLVNCYSGNKSFFEKMKELALSKKAVEIEANLAKNPKPKASFDFISSSMGPSSELKNFSVNENIRIDKNVAKCHYDTDLKANNALNILYSRGIGENNLSKYLSAGAFGLKKNRKVVPTRWSITAVDDSLGKELISRIKDFPVIDDFKILSGNLFGNYFSVILLPSVYGFELFETIDEKEFMHDFEGFEGRKGYAYETAGGYYASRLAVLEYLSKNSIQASAIVFRKITDEYTMPLGVWVVREACRKSMDNCLNYEIFNDLIMSIDKKWFIKKLRKDSVLFKRFLAQKTLRQFL